MQEYLSCKAKLLEIMNLSDGGCVSAGLCWRAYDFRTPHPYTKLVSVRSLTVFLIQQHINSLEYHVWCTSTSHHALPPKKKKRETQNNNKKCEYALANLHQTPFPIHDSSSSPHPNEQPSSPAFTTQETAGISPNHCSPTHTIGKHQNTGCAMQYPANALSVS